MRHRQELTKPVGEDRHPVTGEHQPGEDDRRYHDDKHGNIHRLHLRLGDIGDQHVTVRISDGSLFVDHTFIISVSDANHAPTFISEPATSVMVGESYVYEIRAQDIDGDALTYSAPVLPGWLTFYENTHVISGTPTSGDIGRHNVTVMVTDGLVDAEQNFRITVENTNSPPTFTSTPVTSVKAGDLYVYNAEAVDVDGDEMTFSAPVLPAWLSFDVNTQVLHGTPSNQDARDHNVTLRVTDGMGSEYQNFVVSVEFVIGIEEGSAQEMLSIFPNPTTGRFFVELSREAETEFTLEILDPVGKVLFQEDYPPYVLMHKEFDLSEHPPGIYFIRIYHNSTQLYKKLLHY